MILTKDGLILKVQRIPLFFSFFFWLSYHNLALERKIRNQHEFQKKSF